MGRCLARHFQAKGVELRILTRDENARLPYIHWDARTIGDWKNEIDGADVVINLAGRSVNCRYTDSNLDAMYRSRIDSAAIIGKAIEGAKNPPRLWLQMSTATIYAHTFGEPHDEETGIIGGTEPNVPRYWDFSIRIATDWEKELFKAKLPKTRKVAMRTAMVMSPDRGGVFDTLFALVRFGLGGAIGDGKQFMSWVHEYDFIRAVEFLIEREDMEGIINICAPNPLPQREFMQALREANGTWLALPAFEWMVKIGVQVIGSDAELVLKSRRVIPGRLQAAGFKFLFQDWKSAATELVENRWGERSITLHEARY